jgi:hypothetical protein
VLGVDPAVVPGQQRGDHWADVVGLPGMTMRVRPDDIDDPSAVVDERQQLLGQKEHALEIDIEERRANAATSREVRLIVI